MNEIKIILTVPGLPEAINNLAEAIHGSKSVAASAEQFTAQATQSEAAPTANPTPAQQAVSTPQNGISAAGSASTQPAANVQSAHEAQSLPSDAAVNYTIEQISVAGAALCEQGKVPQLIALLNKYGVQAVTQLNPAPENLNAFAAELKALGANL